jgi:AcrR family transcriptional regulator
VTTRQYDNSLRRQQASTTRTRILEAVRDLLVEAPASLQIPEIAARAGVSEPTVYRHFPNRDALLDAAAGFVSAELGEPPQARTIDELPVVALAVARFFARNASWIRAAMTEPLARPLRSAGRRRRVEHMRRVIAPALAHLAPTERSVAAAAFATIARAERCPG